MPARFTAFLTEHWLILLLGLGAAVSAIRALLSFRSTGTPRTGSIFATVILTLLAFGDFLPAALQSRSLSATQISLWTVYAALGGLFLAVIVLIATGYWWPPLALLFAASLFLGLGGLLVTPIQASPVHRRMVPPSPTAHTSLGLLPHRSSSRWAVPLLEELSDCPFHLNIAPLAPANQTSPGLEPQTASSV